MLGYLSIVQMLPGCSTLEDRALVEDLAHTWHLEHYDMEPDIESRDNNPSVQHLSFLYGVRAVCRERFAVIMLQLLLHCCVTVAPELRA